MCLIWRGSVCEYINIKKSRFRRTLRGSIVSVERLYFGIVKELERRADPRLAEKEMYNTRKSDQILRFMESARPNLRRCSGSIGRLLDG
jgi:hypothetical protein